MTTREQIPIIAQVEANEKWLLGERIGEDPGPHHPELLDTLCAWVIAHGAELRNQNKEEQ
jgi:hypothetical protein